jgi:hypothetical protein
MLHPAYSPNLAPSDFFFGYIKRKFTEYEIPDRESLKSVIAYMFGETGQDAFILIFET